MTKRTRQYTVVAGDETTTVAPKVGHWLKAEERYNGRGLPAYETALYAVWCALGRPSPSQGKDRFDAWVDTLDSFTTGDTPDLERQFVIETEDEEFVIVPRVRDALAAERHQHKAGGSAPPIRTSLYACWHAMAGNGSKPPFRVWLETVVDVEGELVEDDDESDDEDEDEDDRPTVAAGPDRP